MIKTAPHSTKRLVYTPPDLLARFVKQTCQTEKILPDLLSKYLFSSPNVL